MKQLMLYEYHKTKNSLLFYIILIICCIITLFFCSTSYLSDPIIPATPNNLLGIFMSEAADVGIGILIISGCFSLYSFGEDFSMRTINLELLGGYSRRTIFFSHCFKIFLLTGSIISFSLIMGCFKFIPKFAISFNVEDFLYLVRTFLIIYMLAFSMISTCIVFVVLFQDTSKTTVVSFITLFIAFDIMGAIVSNSSPLWSAYEGNISLMLKLYLPYLWRWSLRPDLSISEIIFVLVVAVTWSLFFLELGYNLFKRKEIR